MSPGGAGGLSLVSFFVRQGGEELRQHTWSLEEQVARLQPIINLVDNMVKLGTLYRGLNSTAGRPAQQHHNNNHRQKAEVTFDKIGKKQKKYSSYQL